MNELLMSTDAPFPVLVLVALAGAALGAMFFGGLWYTARRGAASPSPALWFFGSLLLRMAITLPGFYVAAGGRWERMLACLLGFLVARTTVMRLTRPTQDSQASVPKEARHAP
ncbi:MAG: ATP synthase subunit I [Ramlibacter sp.]